MFHLWLVSRFLVTGRRLNLPSLMSLIGMTIGVACLVVAMGVVSGFEATLRQAVTDVAGHVLLVKRSDRSATLESLKEDIEKIAPEIDAITPFVGLEALVAHDKRVSGVHIQGVDPESVEKVLRLQNRVIEGRFDFGEKDGVPAALVGKGLVKKYGLKVGEKFRVVLPVSSPERPSDFTPKAQSFYIAGVLDFGKHEYDERYIISHIKAAQNLGNLGDRFSGVRIRLKNEGMAREVSRRLAGELGPSYFTMDWFDVNRNLFEAVKLEKVAIFFVLLIIIIAASFNISSTLFVSVLQRFSDISILKAMGSRSRDITRIFTLQGVLLGMIGAIAGLVLGLVLCVLFVWIQRIFPLVPAEIYKLDRISVDVRLLDLVMIFIATFLISLVSTLTPAIRGSKLNPVEGLRYE